MTKKPYWTWSWIARWVIPLPLLLKYSRWRCVNNHVWYQDADVTLAVRARFEDDEK